MRSIARWEDRIALHAPFGSALGKTPIPPFLVLVTPEPFVPCSLRADQCHAPHFERPACLFPPLHPDPDPKPPKIEHLPEVGKLAPMVLSLVPLAELVTARPALTELEIALLRRRTVLPLAA
jgi:hypothetical protein